MAMDMFLKVGDIKGESEDGDSKHKGTFDILAWSWGVSNSGTAHVGGGAGAGKANFQDISVTKYVDLGSPDLLLAAADGKHIPEAKLTVRKAGEKPLEYIVITMKDCLITSVSTGGSGGEDRLTENVTINFAQVQFQYTEQSKTGAASANPQVGWDIRANKKL